MPQARTDWSEERIDQLKAMWAGGSTCSEIARVLGAGATRSAVIGKIHRMGLATRLTTANPAAVRHRRIPDALRKAELAKTMAKAEDPLVLDSGEFVTMETVSNRTCRWPIGDPQAQDFHFCGHAPKPDRPYCEAHCRESYQPVTTRVLREDDGRRSNGRHTSLRRSSVSLWE
jgi:GcrA cell cycle regulator